MSEFILRLLYIRQFSEFRRLLRSGSSPWGVLFGELCYRRCEDQLGGGIHNGVILFHDRKHWCKFHSLRLTDLLLQALCSWFYPGQESIAQMLDCSSVAQAISAAGAESTESGVVESAGEIVSRFFRY